MIQKKKNNIGVKALKAFIISWNNKFPCDKAFRRKYNIPFNSSQHREWSQIDIFVEILEDKLIEKQYEEFQRRNELLEDYRKTGEYLIDIEDQMSDEEKDDVFDKLMAGIKKVNDK